MKLLKLAAVALITLTTTAIQAQNLDNDFKALQNQVESAYKKNVITETDYNKLKQDHKIIQQAISQAEADGVTTNDERNKIYSKLLRSKKRFSSLTANNKED
jgi:peptidoglycan hydrolase CwlO-like protein